MKGSLVDVLIIILNKEYLNGYQLLAHKYRLPSVTTHKFVTDCKALSWLCSEVQICFHSKQTGVFSHHATKILERIRSMAAAKSLQQFHGSECSSWQLKPLLLTAAKKFLCHTQRHFTTPNRDCYLSYYRSLPLQKFGERCTV